MLYTTFFITTVIIIQSVKCQNIDIDNQGSCGGHLKATNGIIQTPNFPNAFTVPIKCRWIIEQEEVNGTISIYFTQQYTTSGLSFTEYVYYDDTYKLGERKALTVTEENITKVKWLQVQSPVLVVELNLDRLEGTQLRALGLLSVFGFNITYTIRGPTEPPGPTSCSAIECRLLGHCFANNNHSEFFCSCFEGYSGRDCGIGPLCSNSSEMCKNGGTCRQLGPAAVGCICAEGYTGDLCEAHISSAAECGADECRDGCGTKKFCNCAPRASDNTAARFETIWQTKQTKEDDVTFEKRLIAQITNNLLLSNITLLDDIESVNLSIIADQRALRLRMWAPKSESGLIRAALARLATTGGVTSLPHLQVYPALSLQSLVINQRTEVWEGSEFILSCIAYGSPDILFTWYKDGSKVNFGGTNRDMWTRTVSEDALGRRMSVLGISEARPIDSGKWSCTAEDSGRKRCKSLRVALITPPHIQLSPSTITVNKGANISITCLAEVSRTHGALGFSWAREKTLVRMMPGREVWEDLYPTGSVLKLYHIQKSGMFQCQVTSIAGTSSRNVQVWTISSSDEWCDSETALGLKWPITAPGAHAVAACPPKYIGETSRFCEPKTASHQTIKWKSPNFSGCIADSLDKIYKQFIRLSFGYSWNSLSTIIEEYKSVMKSLPSYPGSGAIPLRHIREMLQYLLSPAAKHLDKQDSVSNLLKIYDHLLTHLDTFLDEERVIEVQQAITETASLNDVDLSLQEFHSISKAVHDEDTVSFSFDLNTSRKEKWLLNSAEVGFIGKINNGTTVVVQYNNLAAKLPSLNRSLEFKNGREIEYVLATQQLQVWAGGGINVNTPHLVTLRFRHIHNYTIDVSKLACGLRTYSNPKIWSIKECEVEVTDINLVACKCRGLGTFALFNIASTTRGDSTKELQDIVKITVGLASAMCLAAAVLQLVALVPGRDAKLPALLKVTTAGLHAVAMWALLECNFKTEQACKGGYGWIVGISWCIGGAALCAQPLILQADMAGRAQVAPAIALLSGVCILALLTARTLGGEPLQLGSEAQIVCSTYNLLLAILCVVLALSTAHKLSILTRKLSADRRTYLKNKVQTVRQSLIVAVTTCCIQISGIAYVQPGVQTYLRVTILALTALINGCAIFMCYVICDEECVISARKALSIPFGSRDRDSREGETSMNLYIRGDGEEESRGGVDTVERFSSPTSSASQNNIYCPPHAKHSNSFYR